MRMSRQLRVLVVYIQLLFVNNSEYDSMEQECIISKFSFFFPFVCLRVGTQSVKMKKLKRKEKSNFVMLTKEADYSTEPMGQLL